MAQRNDRLVMTLRLDPEVARKVDAVRGGLSRSEWLERAVAAFLESGAVLPALTRDAEQADRLRKAIRGSAELMARIEAARSRPLPSRCLHRKRSAYCPKCQSLIDPDGLPVRAP